MKLASNQPSNEWLMEFEMLLQIDDLKSNEKVDDEVLGANSMVVIYLEVEKSNSS